MKTLFVSLLLVFVMLGERASFAQGRSVTVTAADVNKLTDRLVAFRSSLSANDARTFDQIICRAASVRAESGNVRISSRPFSEGIVVQGGRQGSTKGVILQENPLAKALGNNPRAVGPKQDDPVTPPEHANKAFRDQLVTFGSSLSAQERSMMDWMFARASQATGAPNGTPGGYPPSSKQGVRSAFGIIIQEGDVSPDQHNPKPPHPGPISNWTLSFN